MPSPLGGIAVDAEWSAADGKDRPEFVIFPSDNDFRTQHLPPPMVKASEHNLDSFPYDLSFRLPTHSALSKPAIVVENANGIHIHVDNVPESLMSSIQSTVTSSSAADDSHTESPYAPSETSPIAIKNRSVRFRSRVRITSGLPRRHATADRITPDSSLSSSPSSSISAPLRCSEHDVNTDSSPWGPLGQRVKHMVQRPSRRAGQRQIASRGIYPNERSPLVPSRRSLEEDEHYNYFAYLDDETRLNREIDLAFGTWPGRLLNRHWWWWHIEPILCCICIGLEEEEQR